MPHTEGPWREITNDERFRLTDIGCPDCGKPAWQVLDHETPEGNVLLRCAPFGREYPGYLAARSLAGGDRGPIRA